jgi:hypothetical protein
MPHCNGEVQAGCTFWLRCFGSHRIPLIPVSTRRSLARKVGMVLVPLAYGSTTTLPAHPWQENSQLEYILMHAEYKVW